MNTRALITALLLAAVLVGGVVLLARTQQTAMENALPPRHEFATLVAASDAALAYRRAHGGTYTPIAGTGSMAPYIPAGQAKTLAAQATEIVAFVVTAAGKTFADVAEGSLVIYRPEWNERRPVMHQAAQFDGGGWIMTGLHNAHSESMERMTADKFTGLVAAAFVVKGSP